MSHIHRFLPACGAKAGLPFVLLAGLGLSAVPPGPGEAEHRLPNPHAAIPSELQPGDQDLEVLKAQANAAAMKGDTQEYERIIGTYRQLKGTLITPHSRSHSTRGSLVNTATSAQALEAQWSATVSTGSVSQTLNPSATSGSSSVSATPSALTLTGSLTATGASVANGSGGAGCSLEQELENLTTGQVSYLPGPAAAASSSSAASLPAHPGRPLLTSAGNQALPLLPDFADAHLTAFTPAQVAAAPEEDSFAEAFSGPCELAHAQALADHWNLRVDIFERVPDAQDVNGQTAIRSLHQLNPGKRPNDSRFRLLCQNGHYSLVREARAGEVPQYLLAAGTGFVHPEAFPLAGQPVFQPVPADEDSFIAALFCAVQGDLPKPGEIASIRKDITRKMLAPAASVNAAGSSLAAAQ